MYFGETVSWKYFIASLFSWKCLPGTRFLWTCFPKPGCPVSVWGEFGPPEFFFVEKRVSWTRLGEIRVARTRFDKTGVFGDFFFATAPRVACECFVITRLSVTSKPSSPRCVLAKVESSGRVLLKPV